MKIPPAFVESASVLLVSQNNATKLIFLKSFLFFLDSMTSDDCWVTRSSFTKPSTLGLVNLPTFIKNGTIDEISIKKMKALPSYFNSQGLVEIQREAISKDGTKIPYFLVMKEGMKLDGKNPTLLYGYGGFMVSLLPSYAAVTGACWLQNGGVYVSANIR